MSKWEFASSTYMQYPLKRKAILIAVTVILGSFSISIVTDTAEASSLSIIDYDYEGIAADSTQYFVLWNRGSQEVDLIVNATVLEFVGSTGWPQLEMRIFQYQDYNYSDGHLAFCSNFENYTCRLDFNALNNTKYVLAVSNIDSSDDATYNLTISSEETVDFQYTSMFDVDDVSNPQDNTISITYFEQTNPFLYRLESQGTSRVVLEYIPYSTTDEMYFFIINKGETCNLYVGLLGIPYLTNYPDLTSFVIDFEDYGKEDNEILYLWTISNYSTGGYFECESGHRYNFWIDLGYYRPDLYIVFDTFGAEDLNFDSDLLTANPDGEISVRLSFTDPWVEFQQLNRDVWNFYLGIGGSVGAIGLFSIWYLRRRYY